LEAVTRSVHISLHIRSVSLVGTSPPPLFIFCPQSSMSGRRAPADIKPPWAQTPPVLDRPRPVCCTAAPPPRRSAIVRSFHPRAHLRQPQQPVAKPGKFCHRDSGLPPFPRETREPNFLIYGHLDPTCHHGALPLIYARQRF
jgi:hypothetical protein